MYVRPACRATNDKKIRKKTDRDSSFPCYTANNIFFFFTIFVVVVFVVKEKAREAERLNPIKRMLFMCWCLQALIKGLSVCESAHYGINF